MFGTSDDKLSTEPTVTASESNLSDLFRDTASDLDNDVELSKVSSTTEREQKKGVSSSTTLSTNSESKAKRKGVWKRVRVRPLDNFETAESQNIGNHFYNSLVNGDNGKEFGDRFATKNNANDGERSTAATPLDIATETTTKDKTFPLNHKPAEDDEDEYTTIASDEADVTTLTSVDATTMREDETDIETTEVAEGTTTESKLDETTILPTTSPQNEEPTESGQIETTTDIEAEKKDRTKLDKREPEMSQSESRTNVVTMPAVEHRSDNDADDSDDSDDGENNSIMDEVKKRLSDLFSFDDDDVVVSTTERVFRINRNFSNKKEKANIQYTTIDRQHAINEIMSDKDEVKETKKEKNPTSTTMKLEPVPMLKTILKPVTETSSFHKNLMDSVVFATSTSTEISHETEICYRGRCVKTQQKP